MESSSNSIPMEQVTKPAEDPVLGNEGAEGTTPEEGVYGSMVVKKQVYGGVVTVGRQGEGANSAIEFSRLLGDNPWWTQEEPNAHGGLPDPYIVSAPRRASSISKVSGGIRQRRTYTIRRSPGREAHCKCLKGGPRKMQGGAG